MVSELEPSSMALNTQATQIGSTSSSQRELTPMEDPRSPFFLHHGETPGAILVTQPLTEDNVVQSNENGFGCQKQTWIR